MTNIVEPFFRALMCAITADLIIRKLLDDCSNTGKDVSMFEPHLYKVVFPLAGINTERQYNYVKDWYDDQIERIIAFEITNTKKIDMLAKEILLGLMERRNEMRS